MNGLIEGKKYVLSTPVDTVITDVKYNIPLGTVKAGQQYVFQAVSDAVTVADGCTIRPFEGSNGASVGVVGGSGDGGSGGSSSGDYLNYTFAEDGTYSIKGEMPNFVGSSFDKLFSNELHLTKAEINFPALTNGYYLFFGCTDFASFSGNLDSLKEAHGMFDGCGALETFNSELPLLENGYLTFMGCTNLKSFKQNLPHLTNGNQMFSRCSNLEEFKCSMPLVKNFTSMFQECCLNKESIIGIIDDFVQNNTQASVSGNCWTGVSADAYVSPEVQSRLNPDFSSEPSLTGLYCYFTNQKGATLTMPIKVTYIRDVFDANADALTYGKAMFKDNMKLKTVTSNFPTLTNGTTMFAGCTSLTSFTGDLSSLTNGVQMFTGCSYLTSFNCDDLSKMTDGSRMFAQCHNLTSFSSDLSSLTRGYYMFEGCKNLTSFRGDLSSLTDGAGMFGTGGTNAPKLDLASVQNIAETINDIGSKGLTGSLSITIAAELQSSDAVNEAVATIRAKGWSVRPAYA